MEIVKLKNLSYGGDTVGARVVCNNKTYDISSEDLNLIVEDFNVEVGNSGITDIITLKNFKNHLVPVGAPNVDELTYGMFCSFLGVDYFKDTDVELKTLYNKFNREYFSYELPRLVKVVWSNRMTRGAGLFTRETHFGKVVHKISISVPYHQKFPNELVDTLVHEMIHVKHPKNGHGSMFHYEKDRINSRFGLNIAVYATERATPKKVNYVYACRDCGYEYERVKRHKNDYANGRCGVCKGSIYLKENYVDDWV